MYALQGFIVNKTFANNTVNTTAKMGEISSVSITFSREVGIYAHVDEPDIALLSFFSQNDTESNVLVPNDVRDQTIRIAGRVYAKTLTSPNQLDPIDFYNDLIEAVGAEVSQLEMGPVVTDGRYYIPEWLSWRSGKLVEDNSIKIWFTDESFRAQYTNYEIVVIPPVDVVDQFFGTPDSVKVLLNKRTYPQEIELIQTARATAPETVLWAEVFDYVNPHNQQDTTPSKWTCLIYGFAGNNLDLIKEAIVKHILANSVHTRDEWKEILPDLFLRTEFLLIPFWQQVAIPNMVNREGVYSPLVNPKQAYTLVKATVLEYPASHIDNHLTIFGFPFKSIAIGAIGNVENKGAKYELKDWFPDFINTSTGTIDFARMEVNTMNWSTLISEMLKVAETMTAFSALPGGYTRSTRDGIIYLAKSYMNVNYSVAARSNW